MLEFALIFIVVAALVTYLRRRFSGVGKTTAAAASLNPFATAPGTEPPKAEAWEKQLIAEMLDRKRRGDAEASLMAEIRTLGDPPPTAGQPAADSRSPVAG